MNDLPEHEPLPEWLEKLDDEYYCPNWWKMDGNVMAVFCLDVQKSLRANKPIMEESYCMTQWLGGLIEGRGRVLADHEWELITD